MNQQFGRILLITGAAAIIIGLILIYGEKFPLLKSLGRLPGDIRIKRDNFSFYFPLTTCIILSILATIILRIISKLK